MSSTVWYFVLKHLEIWKQKENKENIKGIFLLKLIREVNTRKVTDSFDILLENLQHLKTFIKNKIIVYRLNTVPISVMWESGDDSPRSRDTWVSLVTHFNMQSLFCCSCPSLCLIRFKYLCFKPFTYSKLMLRNRSSLNRPLVRPFCCLKHFIYIHFWRLILFLLHFACVFVSAFVTRFLLSADFLPLLNFQNLTSFLVFCVFFMYLNTQLLLKVFRVILKCTC